MQANFIPQKYTVQPQGIWARLSYWLQIDSGRSSGVPLNPIYRNPPPGGLDPKAYDDPVTIPAGDIADNPYWKRDVRRSYPKLSTVSQSDVVGLLTVGSQSNPKDDVLQLGDAGSKQLVEVKEEGDKGGLPAHFEKSKKSMAGVLSADGLPPMPVNLGQNATEKKYELLKDQSYQNE